MQSAHCLCPQPFRPSFAPSSVWYNDPLLPHACSPATPAPGSWANFNRQIKRHSNIDWFLPMPAVPSPQPRDPGLAQMRLVQWLLARPLCNIVGRAVKGTRQRGSEWAALQVCCCLCFAAPLACGICNLGHSIHTPEGTASV